MWGKMRKENRVGASSLPALASGPKKIPEETLYCLCFCHVRAVLVELKRLLQYHLSIRHVVSMI